VDGNDNGVRDDVDGYIGALEADAEKRRALTSFAREQTQMMLLPAGTTTKARAAAFAARVRVVKSIDCLAAVYPTPQRQALVVSLKSALFNNAARLRAYHAADKLLSGTILPPPGQGCDPLVLGATR
jgi:hypothetical protein